jgi:outer membrane protein OmpA-like peptidoglycan-associated protein
MCLLNFAAHAAATGDPSPKEPGGIVLGAIVGGLIGGPPAAIIGAAGGGWLGARAGANDNRIVDLEQRLAGREAEFALLQDRFEDLQADRGAETRMVALQHRRSALDELSAGVSLTIHFRTASDALDAGASARIAELARFLADFPEIRVLLDAHSDRRGGTEYNRTLSQRRADAVRAQLLRAGLDSVRIDTHAWGESQARAEPTDTEGLIFDRRVTIRLSLDAET